MISYCQKRNRRTLSFYKSNQSDRQAARSDMILYIRGFLPAKTAIMYLYTTGQDRS